MWVRGIICGLENKSRVSVWEPVRTVTTDAALMMNLSRRPRESSRIHGFCPSIDDK